MSNDVSVFIDIISYLSGAWVAFKVYDKKTRGQKGSHDRLLFGLLLAFVGGGGTLLAYILNAWFGVS